MAFLTWTLGADTSLASNGSVGTTDIVFNLASGGGAIIAAQLKPGLERPLLLGIEDEIVSVVGIDTDAVTVKRAVNGSTAATHANSTKIHILSLDKLYALLKVITLAAAPGA